jgi:hypothetical protein
MLFFFGTKGKGLDSFPVESICEICNQSQHRVHVFQRYFHIFWIPTLPIGKQSVLECQHCRKCTLEKEMSPPQRHLSLPKRSAAKTPAYMFTGLVLIGCLIGWGKYTLAQERANTQTLISSPVANDLAIIQLKNKNYLIFKLVSIENNTIKFQVGNYAYKSYFGAKKEIDKKGINEKDYFNKEFLEMPIEKYKTLNVDFVQRENLAEEL